jgi:hypothetical protein
LLLRFKPAGCEVIQTYTTLNGVSSKKFRLFFSQRREKARAGVPASASTLPACPDTRRTERAGEPARRAGSGGFSEKKYPSEAKINPKKQGFLFQK